LQPPNLARTIAKAFGFVDIVADNNTLIGTKATAITNKVRPEVERSIRVDVSLVYLIFSQDFAAIANLHEMRLRPLSVQALRQFKIPKSTRSVRASRSR
jgi:hypothetical protein